MTSDFPPSSPSPSSSSDDPEYTAGKIERAMEVTFPAAPFWVRQARNLLKSWLGPDHPGVDLATLLLSEAFTNCVLYGGREVDEPMIHVGATLGYDQLRVEVIDEGGNAEPVMTRQADEDMENGRGLALLQSFAKQWGWDRMADQRIRVWFTVVF